MDVEMGPALEVGESRIPLHLPVTLVGRRSRDGSVIPDVDLAPFDLEHKASRRHAELTCDDGIVRVRDLGSTNGTLLNDRPVLASVPAVLRDGDRLSFAGVEARFAARAPWPPGLTAPGPERVADADDS